MSEHHDDRATSDLEHGCNAFGHLASPHVDGELAGTDQERFVTHLPACAPCRRLIDEYRAIDMAWMPPLPTVSEHEWGRAWRAIEQQVRDDRQAAEVVGGTGLVGEVLLGRWEGVRPLAAAAAAFLLVVVLVGVQRGAGPDGPAAGPPAGASRLAGSVGNALDPYENAPTVACKNADWMPVVWTTDGDEPVTVVQCVPLTSET